MAVAKHRPAERGHLIRDARSTAHRGPCGTCEPTPPGRVRADELWARAQAAPPGWRVEVAR